MEALEPSGHSHGKPEDGLECLCTMEDITEDEGNYVEFRSEPSATPGLQCRPKRSATTRQPVGSAGS